MEIRKIIELDEMRKDRHGKDGVEIRRMNWGMEWGMYGRVNKRGNRTGQEAAWGREESTGNS